jgi:hypothetical protein
MGDGTSIIGIEQVCLERRVYPAISCAIEGDNVAA